MELPPNDGTTPEQRNTTGTPEHGTPAEGRNNAGITEHHQNNGAPPEQSKHQSTTIEHWRDNKTLKQRQ